MSLSDIDCTTCGACCFGTHDRYVALLPEDRGRAIPLDATSEIDGRRFLRMCGGHCAQLTRTPDARLVCGIYEVRPEACRAFRAGSFECLKARQHRGHLAEAMRTPAPVPLSETSTILVSAIDAPSELKGPEADLPPAHVIASKPPRSRPRA
ncbi:YkgJ family cysteine cluster protein [Ostreiculturibacter nitratireducens]|uniref:YkgJ family cysteine cluster protein n=1 Tax=Ostreiculturibacter nitratireducens TaxID=3075226 RepID=UPI0031B5E8AC